MSNAYLSRPADSRDDISLLLALRFEPTRGRDVPGSPDHDTTSSGAYVAGNHDTTQQNLILFRETLLLVMENCPQSFSLQIIG
jgi:hypothetical protein